MGGKLDALRRLLAKVEAGTAQHAELDKFTSEWGIAIMIPEAAYEGSLDAAKVLHEALLSRHYAQVHMWPMSEMCRVDIGGGHQGRDDDPARAWLIAILRALIAQEES